MRHTGFSKTHPSFRGPGPGWSFWDQDCERTGITRGPGAAGGPTSQDWSQCPRLGNALSATLPCHTFQAGEALLRQRARVFLVAIVAHSVVGTVEVRLTRFGTDTWIPLQTGLAFSVITRQELLAVKIACARVPLFATEALRHGFNAVQSRRTVKAVRTRSPFLPVSTKLQVRGAGVPRCAVLLRHAGLPTRLRWRTLGRFQRGVADQTFTANLPTSRLDGKTALTLPLHHDTQGHVTRGHANQAVVALPDPKTGIQKRSVMTRHLTLPQLFNAVRSSLARTQLANITHLPFAAFLCPGDAKGIRRTVQLGQAGVAGIAIKTKARLGQAVVPRRTIRFLCTWLPVNTGGAAERRVIGCVAGQTRHATGIGYGLARLSGQKPLVTVRLISFLQACHGVQALDAPTARVPHTAVPALRDV